MFATLLGGPAPLSGPALGIPGGTGGKAMPAEASRWRALPLLEGGVASAPIGNPSAGR